MLELTIKSSSPEEMRLQLLGLLANFKGCNITRDDTPVDLSKIAPVEKAEDAPPMAEVPQKPVVSQEEQKKNVENAPVHEEPKQPTIEEVRAALKELRDRKGSSAVKELLKAYGADSLMTLKPEDYLGALARAKTEV